MLEFNGFVLLIDQKKPWLGYELHSNFDQDEEDYMFHKMKADLIIAEKKWSNEYKKSEYFSRKDPQGFLIFEKGAIQIGSVGSRQIFFSDTLSNDMVKGICSSLGIEVSKYSLKPLHGQNRLPFIHELWMDFAHNGGQGRGYGIKQDERER